MLSFYPHTKILGPTRKMLLPMGVEQPHLIHTAGFVSDHKRLHKPHAPRSSPPQANRNPAENFSLPLSASPPMATMNSSVLACSYALSGASDPRWKLTPAPSAAPPTASSTPKLPAIRAQQARPAVSKDAKGSEGRRAALLGVAATLFAATAANSSPANAGIIDEYLERSKANKELNDKKRSATTGANFARAYTVEFGTCKFPENFTGCQDLAKQKKVPFISDDLEIECEGKDKYKCGSNVFWKW